MTKTTPRYCLPCRRCGRHITAPHPPQHCPPCAHATRQAGYQPLYGEASGT